MKTRDNSLRGLPFFIMAILAVWLIISMGKQISEVRLSRNEFKTEISSGMVENIIIKQNRETPSGEAVIRYKNGEENRAHYYVSDVGELVKELESRDVDYVMLDVEGDNIFLSSILPILLSGLFVFAFIIFMQGRAGGGSGAKMMNFGKSKARMVKDNKANFQVVAGLEEEKQELSEIVDFLKSPKKYTELGARIPKGVILVGPPGTGKTLLAKAVAGEAGVPFFTISGSDFVEMFVGVGASRVRDLFNDAKKNSPCIIFIDEIDAVARKRGSGLGGSHDEREQTLNQLLVEMDGFSVNEGIIVMAATNRVDILDLAILRPGRFDRKVYVGRPDIAGREAILKVHSKGKPLADDVDLNSVARNTSGFSGADLENLMNEAAIITAKENRRYITASDIDKAFIKVAIGAEKKSKVVSQKDREITAYHEAGHAILFRELPDMDTVHTISIIPTGMGAAGYTMPSPGNDELFNTKNKMLQDIMVALGGRIAEEIVFSDVSTGASQDINQATGIAKSMVMKYGMSEKLGLVNYGNEQDEILIGRDFGQTKSYAENTAMLIDEEIKSIINDCYIKAKEIIERNREVLDKCAKLLLEKEKIGYEEFEALF